MRPPRASACRRRGARRSTDCRAGVRRIEVPAGARRIGRAAIALFVDMETVRAGWSPLTLASTRTRSPVGVKPTLPAARLPAVAASFAEALGNEYVIDAQPASIDAATMEATQRVITDLRIMSLLCRGPIVARVRCSAKCTEFPPLPLVGNMWDGSHRPPIFASGPRIRSPRRPTIRSRRSRTERRCRGFRCWACRQTSAPSRRSPTVA